MLNVGLVNVDGLDFPNFALMKISAYHKQCGDSVKWYSIYDKFDVVYKSKIFTYSSDVSIFHDNILVGGTGYNPKTELPSFIEGVLPDYSIYNDDVNFYGFLTRGCIRKCKWCIVPTKEGFIKPYSDIEEITQGRKRGILMDNNVLAIDYGIRQIEKIVKLGIRVDFNQGLDARLITCDVAKLLAKVKWIEYIRLSCDTDEQTEYVINAVEKLYKSGIPKYRMFAYVLVTDVESANRRCEILRALGVKPFAQPYRDYTGTVITVEQKKFARYVNRREIFNSTTWDKYNTYVKLS